MKSISFYFKFILPILIVFLLVRETAVFMATPNEHHLEDVSFFVPELIENDEAKSEFAELVSLFVANKKLVHIRYKSCYQDLSRYSIFNKDKVLNQRIQCLQILDDALKVAPTSPLIWLEKAKLHSNQGNREMLNKSLSNARYVAKRQSWVVYRRVEFSLQNWDELSDVNKANAESDFLHLSQSNTEIVKNIAHYYLLNPNIKEVVEDWIGKTEVKVQRRFVAYVKSGQ